MKIRECWTGSSKDFCYLKDCLSPLTYRQRCFEKQKRPFTGRFCRSATVSLVIWKYGTDFFVRRTDSGIYDVTDETAFRIPGKTDCLRQSEENTFLKPNLKKSSGKKRKNVAKSSSRERQRKKLHQPVNRSATGLATFVTARLLATAKLSNYSLRAFYLLFSST